MKKVRLLLLLVTLTLAMSVAAFAAETRDFSFENGLASDLKELGLFSGVSENDFDLERAPSRTEVLVMLIRVLGEEKNAAKGEWEHPFTDVPAWADKYVGYAYENGLTKGVSETKFGTDTASAATYLTFMLRALGYSDSDGDFAWDAPEKLAKGIGLLPSVVDTENFLRADIVTVSYAALAIELKDTTETLAEKLIAKEAIAADIYADAYIASKITDKENENKTALSAEDIYARCSSAVFYIEIQDKNGTPISSGSGFFIDESGIAVTNYHVIGEAAKAVITLSGSGVKYDVTGVYYYSLEHDIAVIQVGGSGFKTLDVNPFPAKGAATVYAIGSPKGLQNTISQGIISNPRRNVDGNTYMQTTAAISGGSSGGVLLNAYGEVIGITSATYKSGQNLNFARPISYLALATVDSATSLEEYNWNYAEYSLHDEDYTVAAGESIFFEFDITCYTTDGTFPTLYAKSDNEDVAIADIVFGDTFVGIVGISEGTANITLSDSATNDSITFPITVTAGETKELPFVEYFAKVDKIGLNKGATNTLIISTITAGIESEANWIVASNDKKIAKVSEPTGDGNCVSFDITAVKNGTTSIVISSGLSEETLVMPVTVGEQYYVAFDLIKDYAIANGEYITAESEDEEVPEETSEEDTEENAEETEVFEAYYLVEGRTYINNDKTNILYYPESDTIRLRVSSTLTYSDTTFDLVLTRTDATSGKSMKIEFDFPSYGISFTVRLSNPATVGNGKSTLSISNFDAGDSSLSSYYKTYFEKNITQTVVCLLYEFDGWFGYILPDVDMSDLGFIAVDYEAYAVTILG